MVGTAALPHILMRFYTTPTAHEARKSALWSLVFIAVIYLTAPALAILVKGEVYSNLVGTAFADLPAWLQSWARLDSNLVALAECMWFEIQPVAAGIFGVPVAFALTVAVSLVIPRRNEREAAFVDYLREPDRVRS